MTPDYTPKGIGRLIDEAVAVYRADFRTLVLPAAYVLLPVSLFIGLAQGWYGRALQRAIAPASPDPMALLSALSGPYALLAAVASIQGIVSLYYFACVLSSSSALLARQRVAAGEFLKGGWRPLLAMFVISLAVWFVGTVPMMVGLVLLLVPGILVGLGLAGYAALAQSVAGIEHAPIDRALGRAFSLMRGHFWRTVGFFVSVGILTFALESAITSFSSIPIVLQQLSGGASGNPIPSVGWQVFTGVLQGVAQTLVLPFVYVAYLHFYLDLRSRREGMDLLARAHAMSAEA